MCVFERYKGITNKDLNHYIITTKKYTLQLRKLRMIIEQYFQIIWAINSIGRVPPLHGGVPEEKWG